MKIKRTFKVKSVAIAWFLDLVEKWDWTKEMVVSIDEMKRREEQSRKFHAMCNEISQQVPWDGEMRTPAMWKSLLVSGHTYATKNDVELVKGIEGEVLNIRESTSEMTIRRMASLIEYTSAWSAGNGVVFADNRYDEYPEFSR